MLNTRIERVLPEEIEKLQKFSRETFSETYSEFNSPENMGNFRNKIFL